MPQGVPKKADKKTIRAMGYGSVESFVERRGGCKTVHHLGRTVQARNYHLTKTKLEAKLAAWHTTGRFVSPYTRSVLSDFLHALSNLGINEVHTRAAVKDEMSRIMSIDTGNKLTTRVRNGISDWDRFNKRASKSTKPWTVMKRIEATARSLRKTKKEDSLFPIGRKLEQMGCCVDIFRLKTKEVAGVEHRCTLLFRLNTHSTKPLCMLIDHEDEIPEVNLNAKTLGPD